MKRFLLFLLVIFTLQRTATSQHPPWYFINTVHNHIVLVLDTVPLLIDTIPMEPGDFIGAFYTFSGSHICGSGTGITGDVGGMMLTGDVNAITIWGAEPNVFNGFQQGEEFIWKVWRSSDGSIFEALATYDIITLPDSGNYVDEGLSKLASLQAYSIPGLNLSVNSQSTPVSGCGYPDPQQVSVTLQNHDTIDIIGFDVYFTINGVDTVSEYVNDTLFASGYYEYTFDNMVDLSQVGIYNFYVWIDYFGDVNNTNDYNSKEIIISESPVVSIGPDRSICERDSVPLQADELFVEYLWNTGVDHQFIYVATDGYYSLTITDEFGCNGVDSMYLTVYPEPQVNLIEEVSFCEDSYTNITILERFQSIKWSNGSLKPNLYITYPGTYTVTVTDFVGCTVVDTVVAIELPYPVVNMVDSILTQTLDTVLLNAGSGFEHYIWNTNETTQIIQPEYFGLYSVTVTKDGCEGSGEVLIVEQDSVITSVDFLFGPNPVVDELKIKFPFAEDVTIVVFNPLRQAIDAWVFENIYDTKINVSSYSPGVYILYVRADDNYYTRRFVVSD